MKLKCQVCTLNFVEERDVEKENHMDMLFYWAQSSSAIICVKQILKLVRLKSKYKFYKKKKKEFNLYPTHMSMHCIIHKIL